MSAIQNEHKTYHTLNPQVANAIENDRQNGIMHPKRFLDENIIRRQDNPHDTATIARPAFVRDVEKIVNLPAYNRYAGKTQVFSFVENDDITRRGLHIQLVNRVAKSIGQLLGLNTDLIEAIALGHDLGHTPFGHAGERFLSQCYNQHTGKFFNHNVHSARVLDKLYPRNISLQTLDGVLCHNGEFVQKQLRLGSTETFDQLDDLIKACTQNSKNISKLKPSTLEGCVVRISDMIAYLGKDRDDAMRMGTINSLDVFDSEYIGKTNAEIINNLTVDIVNESYGKEYIEMSEAAFKDIKTAKSQNYELIYLKEGMREDDSNAVEKMFAEMYERLLEDLLSGEDTSPVFRHHINSLKQSSNKFDAEKYIAEDANQVIVDYIASMTDGYFMELYEYLFPSSARSMSVRGYCSDLI